MASEIMRNWPDLSHYNLRMLTVKIPDGSWRLMMLNGDMYPSRMQDLGFKKTNGIWIKSDASVAFSKLSAAFPAVKVISVPEKSIQKTVSVKKDYVPVSSNVPEDQDIEQSEQEKQELDAILQSKKALPIGQNHLGQEVFIGVDGRYIRSDNKILVMTEANISQSLFLKAESAKDLDNCADALVARIANGEIFRQEDVLLFASHIFDRQPEDCAPMMDSLHEAINGALSRKMLNLKNISDAERYALAVKLHEGLPPLSAEIAETIVTLPIGLVAQKIANMKVDLGKYERIIFSGKVNNGALLSNLSSAPEGLTNRVVLFKTNDALSLASKSADSNLAISLTKDSEIPDHDVSLDNLTYERLDFAANINGTRLSRADYVDMIETLEKRNKKGRSVFIIGKHQMDHQSAPGELDEDTGRMLSWLYARFEVEGIVEIDGDLLGTGGSNNSRYLMTIGKAGQTSDYKIGQLTNQSGDEPSAPRVKVIYTHEDLWQYSDHFLSEGQSPDPVPDNPYQSPYIAASNIKPAKCMIPRNLKAPTRIALSKVQRDHGDIDDFVSSELRLDKEKLVDYFDAEQIDAIALALYAKSRGRGFIEADQTGIGKGRVLAAMARHAVLNNQKVVFLTDTNNLFSDFYRDLKAIDSADLITPFAINANTSIEVDGEKLFPSRTSEQIKTVVAEGKIPEDCQMLMGTYSQFNQIGKNGSANKAGLLINEAKGAFVILDEAHKAAGDSHTNENVSQAIDLCGGVIYSSATYAKESKNFNIYSKAFPSSVAVDSIGKTLSRGGDSLAEVFSGMLAEDGVLIRREHDLSKVKFEMIENTSYIKRNEVLADQFAEVLEGISVLMGGIEGVVNTKNNLIYQGMLNKNTEPDSRWVMPNFGSALYAVMRQFFLSINTDFAIDSAVNSLNAGKKPVITLESTNEGMIRAFTDRYKQNKASKAVVEMMEAQDPELAAEDESLDNFDFESLFSDEAALTEEEIESGIIRVPVTFRDLLRNAVLAMTSITEMDKKNKLVNKENADSDDIDRFRDILLAKIDAFPDLNISPIDAIKSGIESAGYSCGEISGRKSGIVTRPDGLQQAIAVSASNKNKIIASFNSGMMDAIVLTTAGAAGISLHADVNFKDQRQREMFELQIANNVATRVQMLGRVNRNGQTSYPLVKSISSGLPAESRYISMQNAKLRKMSANTTSNRNTQSADNSSADLINKVGNAVAIEILTENQGLAERLLIKSDVLNTTPEYFINMLVGRMGLLPVAQQRIIFADINNRYRENIQKLDEAGENPLRSTEMDINAKIIRKTDISGSYKNSDSVFELPVFLTEISYEEKIKIVSFATLEANKDKNLLKDYPNGIESHIKALLVELDARTDEMLDSAWSTKKNPSREAALLDPMSSASIVLRKLNYLKHNLANMIPGNVIKIDSIFYSPENYVSSVELPLTTDENLHLLGSYRINMSTPYGYERNISLYSQYEDEVMIEQGSIDVFSSSENDLNLFKENLESTQNRVNVRHAEIVDGNLFAAAELSQRNKVGTAIIYTNDQSDRCRGILLPKRSRYHKGASEKIESLIADAASAIDINIIDKIMSDIELAMSEITDETKLLNPVPTGSDLRDLLSYFSLSDNPSIEHATLKIEFFNSIMNNKSNKTCVVQMPRNKAVFSQIISKLNPANSIVSSYNGTRSRSFSYRIPFNDVAELIKVTSKTRAFYFGNLARQHQKQSALVGSLYAKKTWAELEAAKKIGLTNAPKLS